ncbi:hypothetical protein RGQ15_14915 [Paracoccus sp. MBLB3053]|uniref:DUF6894 domain-containing protein n=1 Tax=Paracoccus aurantius TaxID=3073814 RepID=A0ABU2HWG7_9RHOB|nr:hypothetical protein [Paracoccus sp. MBLB3053]MDS9468855.1 hypothetical protein [Paracoccus sp. MBLB3053]
MPRYFFDIDDGTRLIEDDTGLDLPDSQSARRMAIAVLPPIARDVMPNGDRQCVSVLVRDARDAPVFRARLELVAEWLDRSAA